MRRGKRSKRFKDETGVKMTYRQEHSSEGFDVHSFMHKTQIFQKIRSGEGLEGGGDLLVHIFTSTGIFKKMSTPSPFERGPTSPTTPLLHNYMCLIKPIVKHAYFAFVATSTICNLQQISSKKNIKFIQKYIVTKQSTSPLYKSQSDEQVFFFFLFSAHLTVVIQAKCVKIKIVDSMATKFDGKNNL